MLILQDAISAHDGPEPFAPSLHRGIGVVERRLIRIFELVQDGCECLVGEVERFGVPFSKASGIFVDGVPNERIVGNQI